MSEHQSEDVNINDIRRMLVKLLTKPGDGEVEIHGLEDVSDELYLIISCSARIIEHVICHVSAHERKDALEGLDMLTTGMRARVSNACHD